MTDTNKLLQSIDDIHTTELGKERIRKNLSLNVPDVVRFCKNIILAPNCRIIRKGKNWYCEADGIIVTVNAHSKTVITAHRTGGSIPSPISLPYENDGFLK